MRYYFLRYFNEDSIIEYVENNIEHLFSLTKKYYDEYLRNLETNDKVFHADIKKQYKKIINEIMADDISKNLGVDIETIYSVLENKDFDFFRKIFNNLNKEEK